MFPPKTIERFSLYRRLAADLQRQKTPYIFSHQLAALAQSTPAQVRRDLMNAGITGSSSKGYDLNILKSRLEEILSSSVQKAALVGIGNLGRAILSYFPQRSPSVRIIAAFDIDSSKTGRVIHGCRTYPIEELDSIVEKESITLGVITTPREAAQKTADSMVSAGILGILNFAPIPIRVPAGIFTESLDLTTSLEKLAYFTRTPY